jgi:hypothetical protein
VGHFLPLAHKLGICYGHSRTLFYLSYVCVQCSDAVATAAGGVAAQLLSDRPTSRASTPARACCIALPALSAPEDCWKPPLTRLPCPAILRPAQRVLTPTSPSYHLTTLHYITTTLSVPAAPATHSTPPHHSAHSTSQRLLGGPSSPPPQHVIRAHNWTTAPRSARSRREHRSTRLSHAGSPTLLSRTPS